MSFEERLKKFENPDTPENKVEKELSLSEIDELLKESEKVSGNLDKFSKDIIFKKENFEDSRITVDKLDERFDEEAYAKAGFWKKFENFTRFGLRKERYDLIKSERGLLDKTKINKDVLGKGFKLGEGNNQEREYLESNVIDIQGDFKKDNKSERETMKAFSVDDVDGKIIKIVGSGRTEKGQIEAAGKMREAEISRLETVNGAELVGLKEAMIKNSENKKNFSEIDSLLSTDGREKIGAKLNEEEIQTKELIKEKEEKLAEETKKFIEPLEGRLKETVEMENVLSKALDFLEEEDVGLKKKIKEYEDGINKTLKNFSGEVGVDIVKDLKNTKDVYEAKSKEFTEKKGLVSSKLEILKNNKKEIEATLSRVNNIGKTKQEIADKEKSKEEAKTETKPTEEKKDDEEKEKTWDETRDEVWGLANKGERGNARQVQPSGRSGEGRSYIDKLFEHYDYPAFEETNESDDKKKEAEKKVETKKKKKTDEKDKTKETKITEAVKNSAKSKKTESEAKNQIETNEESGVAETDQVESVKFTDKEIENIVMKKLKALGFMNNKELDKKSKDGLTNHLKGAVKNEISKSAGQVNKKFIKNQVDYWYERLTKGLNEKSK